nr:hypothetical protein CFP56_49708 [Quercus suber]POF22593.1 hypothetical protein CFP56_49709 [Quercus suber]
MSAATTPKDASAATPGDTPAATPMQHSMLPNPAANASGTNASGAIINAAQINRSPARSFSELKNMKTCNCFPKRQCGLLSLLD